MGVESRLQDKAARRVTSKIEMDSILTRLDKGAGKFAKLSLDERIALAKSMQRGLARVAAESVQAAQKAKGLPPEASGEDWACGPWIGVRALRLIIESLNSIKATGTTPIGPVTRTKEGKLSVRVFPSNAMEGILFKDVSVDVHMAVGITEPQMHEQRASFYKKPMHDGRVVLVLGAGNINAIPVWDVVSKMFVEGKVCVLKMNPVNAYLGPFIEDAFAEAIDQGFLAVVYGGAEEGSYLAQHDDVDEVHLTGSDRTYEAIVWGPPGEERNRRMRENKPRISKPMTAELGNVSPVIIAPGPYTDKELRYQAEELVGAVVMNAAFCCCTPRVLITAENWPQREKFLGYVADAFAKAPARLAYYPGAEEVYRRAIAGRNNVQKIGAEKPGVLPWTLVTGLDPFNTDEPAFQKEMFCPVLYETALDGADTAEFLYKAVDFANSRLWGTLNATLVVHPKVQKDKVLGPAVESAISWLDYGTVGVNAYPAMSFAYGTPPWGAYPGSKPTDIQSGRGFVHNARMLEGAEKAVMRNPLTMFPKPPYFPSHRTAGTVCERLTALEANPSWWKMPGIVMAAMRG